MVAIPLLQAQARHTRQAGIQCGGLRDKDSKPQKPGFPLAKGKREGEVDFYSTVSGVPGFEPKSVQLL
jgi:hypothetical protein